MSQTAYSAVLIIMEQLKILVSTLRYGELWACDGPYQGCLCHT